MLVKAVLIFLAVMVGMAMLFKQLKGGKKPLAAPPRCPSCGRHRIGKAPCPCGAGGKGK